MIRHTVNGSIKTVVRDAATLSQSIEITEVAAGPAEHTEATWDALDPGDQLSPVHSHEHWDGSDIAR